jgi:hypothetical protein
MARANKGITAIRSARVCELCSSTVCVIIFICIYTPTWQPKRRQRKLCVQRINAPYANQIRLVCIISINRSKCLYPRKSRMDRCASQTSGQILWGGEKQSKRFQRAQAATHCVHAAHPHATITAVGNSLGQITKGSSKQITFNKATSLHDVLSKRRKGSRTDFRKQVMSFRCSPMSKK